MQKVGGVKVKSTSNGNNNNYYIKTFRDGRASECGELRLKNTVICCITDDFSFIVLAFVAENIQQ